MSSYGTIANYDNLSKVYVYGIYVARTLANHAELPSYSRALANSLGSRSKREAPVVGE